MADLGSLIPLIILLVVLAGGGYIAYQMYLWSAEMKDKASEQMETKNIGFTKEGGLRVGVKSIDDETYTGRRRMYWSMCGIMRIRTRSRAQAIAATRWHPAPLDATSSRTGLGFCTARAPDTANAAHEPNFPDSGCGRAGA
ncbi:hypothetical protein LTR03_004962 [Friedmanniomyces endolithicus]|nr:hypothetical protein LTR03_004962 [Friedmanniomyces endolithicus]